MNYNTHKLNSQNHSHIIDRQDSVTGDTIKANNEVVFCSACQSVFLVESWEYMNQKHCNQTETLDFVPAQQQRIEAKKNIFFLEIPITKLDFYLGTTFLIIRIVPALLFLLFMFFKIDILSAKIFVFPILVAGIFALIHSIYKKKQRLFKQTGNIKVWGKEIFLSKKICEDKPIKKIVYNCTDRHLRIYYNEINYNNFDLSSKIKFPNNIEFLNNLIYFSEYTEVQFYAQNSNELQFLQEQKQKYRLNIDVIDENTLEIENRL